MKISFIISKTLTLLFYGWSAPEPYFAFVFAVYLYRERSEFYCFLLRLSIIEDGKKKKTGRELTRYAYIPRFILEGQALE